MAARGAVAAGGKNRTHWISRRRHAIGYREPIGLPELTEQGVPSNALLCCDMSAVLYRCPDTGLNVQGWLADDGYGERG